MLDRILKVLTAAALVAGFAACGVGTIDGGDGQLLDPDVSPNRSVDSTPVNNVRCNNRCKSNQHCERVGALWWTSYRCYNGNLHGAIYKGCAEWDHCKTGYVCKRSSSYDHGTKVYDGKCVKRHTYKYSGCYGSGKTRYSNPHTHCRIGYYCDVLVLFSPSDNVTEYAGNCMRISGQQCVHDHDCAAFKSCLKRTRYFSGCKGQWCKIGFTAAGVATYGQCVSDSTSSSSSGSSSGSGGSGGTNRPTSGSTCSYNGGSTWRKCKTSSGGCGWQYCNPQGKWYACQTAPSSVCGSTSSGSTSSTSSTSTSSGSSCNYNGGNTWRKCGSCGWQYCKPSGDGWYTCSQKPASIPCWKSGW